MKTKWAFVWRVTFLLVAVAGTLQAIVTGREGLYIVKGFVTTIYATALFWYDTEKSTKFIDAVVYAGIVFLLLFYFA